MVEAGSIILGVVAILSALFRAFLKPKFEQAGDAYINFPSGLAERDRTLTVTLLHSGIFKVGQNRNNEHCSTIGLEACEDIWVDQPSGVAYLACSSRTQRPFWETGLRILELSLDVFVCTIFTPKSITNTFS